MIITSAVDITWFQLVSVCRLVEPENYKLQIMINIIQREIDEVVFFLSFMKTFDQKMKKYRFLLHNFKFQKRLVPRACYGMLTR